MKRIENKAEGKDTKTKNFKTLRHGSYAVLITVIVIVVALVINILATMVVNRFPVDLDLTANQDYSISDKNIDYIREVAHPVTITLCVGEGDYDVTNAAGTAQYLYEQQRVIDSTGGRYLQQVDAMLREYTQYNSNITLQYSDPQLPAFTDIQQRFSDQQIGYGYILVESTFEVDGQMVERNRVIALDDMFQLESVPLDAYGMYVYYYITGSNLETELTSAIYSVTSDETTQVLFIAGHSSEEDITALQTMMEHNNYAFSTLDNLINEDIPEETDIVLITAPTSDYSGEELAKLDAFLENDGQRGKTLLFFGSAASPDLPNFYDFLDEWGIHASAGTLYETDSYSGSETAMMLQNSQSDYTASVNDTTYEYVGQDCLPMTVGFDSQGNRTTTQLIATNDTVVVRPAGVGDEFNPDNATKGTYAAGIVSKDTIYAENMAERNSYVIAFSSIDFIGEAWNSYPTVGNNELVLSAVNTVMGRDADDITISTRTINTLTFTQDSGLSRFMVILFMIVLPVAVLATGVIIWVWRRRR